MSLSWRRDFSEIHFPVMVLMLMALSLSSD